MNIEGLSLKLEWLFRRAELETMQDITRRILEVDAMTPTAEYQASRLLYIGMSKKALIEHYSKALGLSKKETEKLFGEVVKQTYTEQEPLYRASGKDFIPYSENAELQNMVQGIIDQVDSNIEGLTSGIANSGGFLINGEFTPLQQYWETNVDSAIMSVLTGAQSKDTVLKKTIGQMTNSGIRMVDYDSGWHNRVDVAVRRAVQTGLQQVTGKINDNNAKALDTDYFEVEAHLGARPTHEEWQGKVYTREELVTVCGLGDVTGLLGANCYHLYYPFVPGVSRRMYTDEQLEQMKEKSHKKKEWNGKDYTMYEAKQQQRHLETQMRAWREKIQLAEDGSSMKTEYQAKYRSLQNEYVKFSEQMGLPQQWQRVTQDTRGVVVKGVKRVEDVTEEYLKNATPGKGKISFDNNYRSYLFKNEISFSKWIKNTLGGDIKLLEEKNKEKFVKNPDYLWNGKFWDLKDISSNIAANSAVRSGIKQIKDNPGGVFVKCDYDEYSIDSLKSVIDKRMEWHTTITADIMIVRNEVIKKVWRYNAIE